MIPFIEFCILVFVATSIYFALIIQTPLGSHKRVYRWVKKILRNLWYILGGQRRTDRLISKMFEGWDFHLMESHFWKSICDPYHWTGTLRDIKFSKPEPKFVVHLDEFTKFEFIFKGKRYSLSPDHLMFLMAPFLKLEEDNNEDIQRERDNKNSKGAWYSWCPHRGIVHRRLVV